ncbi:sulfatase modifying factor 1 [Aliidiomarina minuta]|uniref:Sulfatase modifying factor 1 n=2 Tax=Aliidiomarina minuta TaxID=880057 RepID=A0A432W9A2_9GAMM|nr:sulfatase modifying factor 1 [Aliidiomarina minuta]
MRLVQVALIITAVSLAWLPAQAEEKASVSEIEARINQVQMQYNSFTDQVDQMTAEEQRLRQQLTQLREQSSGLERQRRQALDQMNRLYREMVDNPDTDISAAQSEYQSAVRAHQQNLEQVAVKTTELSGKQSESERIRLSKHSLVNQLELLKEQHRFARVNRLRDEFNRRGELEASQSLTCDRDETIRQCESRAELMAKQRASQSYLSTLFDNLSETDLVSERREESGVDVRVVGSNVVSSEYSGQRGYDVRLKVQMEGRLPRNHACELLGLDQRYCNESTSAERSPGEREVVKKPETESVMHRLVIRSNVHNDQVYIDGQRYGSTPVEVMLEPGRHNVEIARHGYDRYETSVDLRESTVVRGELSRSQFVFAAGERIQDVLSSDLEGPSLIVMPPGRGRVGDVSGNGRSNERPVRSVEFEAPFAVSVAPVTVSQFNAFIDATNHITDAEEGAGCAQLQEGQPVKSSQLNWQNPGYEVSDDMPVTCVSDRDAAEYARWLTRTTGKQYSIPTEGQWEYSARAGQRSDYWWGDSVGVGQANCRGCGGDWSGQQPSPVGTYESNQWGLYDTVGNVWEWTQRDKSSGSVVRGGAFNFAPSLARASARMEISSGFSANYIGFRVTRSE